MPTLTDLAQFVTFHSAAAQDHLWEWFSAQVYTLILTGEQDSLIVRVRQRFSLHKVAAACEGYSGAIRLRPRTHRLRPRRRHAQAYRRCAPHL